MKATQWVESLKALSQRAKEKRKKMLRIRSWMRNTSITSISTFITWRCSLSFCTFASINPLRKDKEVESKKGGLDALFRDGIPLNEHFLALKNRYKKEKKELEDQTAGLERQIADANASNAATARKIEMISDEYEQLNKQHEAGAASKYTREREYDLKAKNNVYNRLRGRLFDENKTIAELKEEVDKKSKEMSQYRSNNAYMLRIQEKNKMFGENKEEKDMLEQERKNNDMIQHYLKKVIDAGTDLESCKRQYDDMTMIKELDNENMELIVFFQDQIRIESRGQHKSGGRNRKGQDF
eukprot:TRINITY_DN1894_c0_g1_i1.p3 TRINITY_DN1894_c0_g1~~TRINITY_DN1894_c0_g1_i1.p3  ORF type:complete len:297 (+),score=50.67 TRINITY_DN1894_c0_g1_i1:4479-5369(+)